METPQIFIYMNINQEMVRKTQYRYRSRILYFKKYIHVDEELKLKKGLVYITYLAVLGLRCSMWDLVS